MPSLVLSIQVPNGFCHVSSDQDRGIHCVRQLVGEFVRHAPEKEGISRWITSDELRLRCL
jgi:hypothetical protein